MKGMISPINATSQGPAFYRLMCITAIILSVLFLVLAVILIGEVKELFWDRALIICVSLYTISLTYKKGIRRKKIYRWANFLFFLFITQLVVGVWLNEFHPAYLILFGVAIQTISIAFKTTKQAFFFLVYATAAMLICAKLSTALDSHQQLYMMVGTFTMFILLLSLVHLKNNFYRENRIKEELLRAIVSKTEDAIFLTDFEGYTFEANARAVELFGYSLKELEGKNFSELRNAPLTEEEDAHGVRQLLRNKFWNSEIELKTQSGRLFYAFVSITWIHRFGREYLLYKVSDISQRKQFEAEIIEARDMAEAATAAKSEFLATMSHEIRTPMNGVLGMTNIMMRSSLNVDQREYLNTIKKSGENLLELLNDILDFSKIESGKMQLEQRDFDLQELVAEVHKLLEANAQRKGLQLELSLADKLPRHVVGDSTRLRQVMVNLVGNAIKFTPSGQVSIKVEKPVNSSFIRFEISDTGIGIQEEEIAKLFQSFTQLDSSMTRKYGGTGLGLAICKNLVELMGGSIWVESSPYKGSTFFFTIPFSEAYEQDNPRLHASALNSDSSAEIETLKGLKALLAEDNLINQHVCTLILQSMGIAVDVANNGLEVQKLLSKSAYDVVLMDVHMPEMDGIEATKWIRSMPEFEGLYIVALTANAFDEDRERCLASGMDDFLTKPMNPDQLLKSLLKIRRNNSELRA